MTKNQLLKKRQAVKRREKLIKFGTPAAIVVVLFFVVRSVLAPKPTIRKAVTVSRTQESYDTDTAQTAAASAEMSGEPGWNVNDLGWWYLNDDMTYFAGGWKTIDGQRYYFTDSGYMATGWVNTGNIKDSYFDASGILDTTKQQKLVALTYDDGPSENTHKLLDALEKYGVKATFFVVGQQADYYTEQLQREVELGMEVGNHSYDHPWLNMIGADEITSQLSRTDNIIRNVAGQDGTEIMRPTGGGISTTVLNTVTKPMIQWDVDTLDWEHLDADRTYERTMELVQDGSVVLMHDLFAPAADSADRMISSLIDEGYKLVTVSELAEAYGYDLQPAYQYFAFYPDGCDLNLTKEQGIAEAES